jgi:hypothetical protein
MNTLIVFDYNTTDDILESFIHQSGIQYHVEDGLIHCLAQTSNEQTLLITLAKNRQENSYLIVNLNENLAYWQDFSGHKPKLIGKWIYRGNKTWLKNTSVYNASQSGELRMRIIARTVGATTSPVTIAGTPKATLKAI